MATGVLTQVTKVAHDGKFVSHDGQRCLDALETLQSVRRHFFNAAEPGFIIFTPIAIAHRTGL